MTFTYLSSACVTDFCSSCQAFGSGTAVSSCCAQTAPAPCFEAAYGAGVSSSTTNANYASCVSALQIFASCSSANPGFASADNLVLAECLCYSSSTWIPDYYDALQSACVRWDSTADPSEVSFGNANNGFCTRVGNVLGVTASASTTGPAAAGATPLSSSIAPLTSPTLSIAVSTSMFPSTSSAVSTPVSGVATPRAQSGQTLLQWGMLMLFNLLV